MTANSRVYLTFHDSVIIVCIPLCSLRINEIKHTTWGVRTWSLVGVNYKLIKEPILKAKGRSSALSDFSASLRVVYQKEGNS